MVAKALEELAAVGVNERPGVALADAGYWHNDAIEKIVNEHHIQTLIAPDADKRKGPAAGSSRRPLRPRPPDPRDRLPAPSFTSNFASSDSRAACGTSSFRGTWVRPSEIGGRR